MREFKHKKQRTEEEQDKVLRAVVTVVVVLLIIGAVIVVIRILNPHADIKEGTKLLAQMEKNDVTKVDAKIIELEKAEKEADEAWQNRTPNEKFANSMILGDSIAQGLYEFGILDASFVAATKGADVTNLATGSSDDLQKAVSVKPQHLFLTYGMNDLKATNADVAVFKEKYREFIKQTKEVLPDTKVYVNSILPTSQAIANERPEYTYVPEFNEQLKALCEEEGITFIDQTESVKEEYYESDGIHFSPDFYPVWLDSMAKAAQL